MKWKLKVQLVKDPLEMVALIEVSISLLSNDPSCFLATMWNFLKHFFNSSISVRNSFWWATSPTRDNYSE